MINQSRLHYNVPCELFEHLEGICSNLEAPFLLGVKAYLCLLCAIVGRENVGNHIVRNVTSDAEQIVRSSLLTASLTIQFQSTAPF